MPQCSIARDATAQDRRVTKTSRLSFMGTCEARFKLTMITNDDKSQLLNVKLGTVYKKRTRLFSNQSLVASDHSLATALLNIGLVGTSEG